MKPAETTRARLARWARQTLPPLANQRPATGTRLPHTVHPQVSAYLSSLVEETDPLVETMEAHARAHRFPMLGRESARWIELLTRMVGARRVFEFGSGWGYSAFFFARAMGPEGRVIGTEKDAHELDFHEEIFDGHPLKEQIQIIQGDALATFKRTTGDFDIVFIDMNKEGYLPALEAAVPRVRPGGLVLADNVLWSGRTAQPGDPPDPATAALRKFNSAIHHDDRLQSAIVPACDGLSVSVRLEEAEKFSG